MSEGRPQIAAVLPKESDLPADSLVAIFHYVRDHDYSESVVMEQLEPYFDFVRQLVGELRGIQRLVRREIVFDVLQSAVAHQKVDVLNVEGIA